MQEWPLDCSREQDQGCGSTHMQLTLSRPVLHMAAHISGVRPVLAAGAFTSAWPFSIRNRTALIDLPSTCTEANDIRHTQLEGNCSSLH